MPRSALVVGAGPAGLSAAEILAQAGWVVTVVEALGSPGRKFLRAGVGGLNLTHSQPLETFLDAYGASRPRLEPWLRRFGPDEIRTWAQGLGIPLFTGSSGKVFPEGLGAAPLLQAWLGRLESLGVKIASGVRWVGWGSDHWFDAVVLALGGPTWPRLGTGGMWTESLTTRGVQLNPWKPANVGFGVDWTPVFREKFAGEPLKEVVLTAPIAEGKEFRRKGELMITSWGLEGGPLYAAGPFLRDLAAPRIVLDLVPGRDRTSVEAALARPRNGRSLSTHWAKTLNLTGAKAGLVREVLGPGSPDAGETARLLKALPLVLQGPRPLDEAISAAGGVAWDELTLGLEFHKIPGVWCAGEMIDWEAPTGGYLLTACLSLGRGAAESLLAGTHSAPVGVTLSNKETP